jgi:hypothetical protein
MKSSFVLADAEPYLKPGTGAINGQAFMRTRGGEAKTAAGLEVRLFPATPYFLERYEAWGLSGNIQPDIPPEALVFRRVTICDAGGNFDFSKLPQGEYALWCNIKWLVSLGPYGVENYSGGVVKGKVTVREGETTKVLLTN